jgi:hypothetical protein
MKGYVRVVFMNDFEASPFPKRNGVSTKIREMNLYQTIVFSVDTNEWTVRSAASQLGKKLNRKFQTHVFEDGSIGVWREK